MNWSLAVAVTKPASLSLCRNLSLWLMYDVSSYYLFSACNFSHFMKKKLIPFPKVKQKDRERMGGGERFISCSDGVRWLRLRIKLSDGHRGNSFDHILTPLSYFIKKENIQIFLKEPNRRCRDLFVELRWQVSKTYEASVRVTSILETQRVGGHGRLMWWWVQVVGLLMMFQESGAATPPRTIVF